MESASFRLTVIGTIDPAMLAKVVHRRFLVDARCALDVGSWRAADWNVTVLGRP
ncbi:MAG TPA: hypothetical protein VFI65_00475 [Streptosporangiaceae bacterium]|nr:hypothetical protein [Streptosporangiaceae bacterium]